CNHITGLDLVRGYVHGRTIHGDRLVRYQLARLGASGTEAHAVNDVVQTALEQLQQVLAGSALATGSFLVVAAELALENAIDATDFLLFAQLGAVVGLATTTLTMLAGSRFDIALRFQSAG